MPHASLKHCCYLRFVLVSLVVSVKLTVWVYCIMFQPISAPLRCKPCCLIVIIYTLFQCSYLFQCSWLLFVSVWLFMWEYGIKFQPTSAPLCYKPCWSINIIYSSFQCSYLIQCSLLLFVSVWLFMWGYCVMFQPTSAPHCYKPCWSTGPRPSWRRSQVRLPHRVFASSTAQSLLSDGKRLICMHTFWVAPTLSYAE